MKYTLTIVWSDGSFEDVVIDEMAKNQLENGLLKADWKDVNIRSLDGFYTLGFARKIKIKEVVDGN